MTLEPSAAMLQAPSTSLRISCRGKSTNCLGPRATVPQTVQSEPWFLMNTDRPSPLEFRYVWLSRGTRTPDSPSMYPADLVLHVGFPRRHSLLEGEARG